MSDLIITILGIVGLSAIAMSYGNEVKEPYMTNVGMKSITEKVMVSQPKMQGGRQQQMKVSAINVADYPKYSQNTMSQKLGSSASTSMPYVSHPAYQQSTPLTSPNIDLPAFVRYKPPTKSQMGITEAYSCKNGNSQRPQTREGYMDMSPNSAGGFMGMKQDPSNPNPGPAFSVGNYNQMSNQGQCLNPDNIDGIPTGQLDMVTAGGESQNVLIYDRPMTTTLKVGRFNQKGVVDMIRGDLPVCLDPNQPKGWFTSPGNPANLTTGSLQAIAGTNESTLTMANFMKTYGNNSTCYGGADMSLPSSQQYVPMSMLQANTGNNGNTVSVLGFA